MADYNDEAPVLEISGLRLSYYTRAGEVPAVMDFDLTIEKGESVGLVGESGCGKSTVANGVMRYMGKNGGIVGGTIKFKGRDMAELTEEEIRRVRGKDISMIYQEPMAALNPSLTIAAQLMEVPMIHEGVSGGRSLPALLRHARGREHSGPETPDGLLSASGLRRPATAGGDRHGALVEAGAAVAR